MSTRSSCEAKGGNFCGSPSTTANCPCTWNPSYPCSWKGSCYSMSTKSSCESQGGDFCVSSPATPSPPPSPPPTPAPPASGLGGWKQAVLDETNKYRALHGAPALTCDDSLASEGQTWSDKCDFKHSTMGNGENLYAGTG